MTKGILVVDKPDTCKECDFYNPTFYSCNCRNKIIGKNVTEKPEWCPIMSIPGKRTLSGDLSKHTKHWMKNEIVERLNYNKGWNDCVNAITGGLNGK